MPLPGRDGIPAGPVGAQRVRAALVALAATASVVVIPVTLAASAGASAGGAAPVVGPSSLATPAGAGRAGATGGLPMAQEDPARAQEDPEPAPLSEEHRRWLEEEVVYIIAEEEKAAFEMLGSDAERDAFIEAFWRARDPSPGTVRNEYREEHYRRIEYANTRLARETPRPGWRTDRGRIYIQLGEPAEIQRYPDPGSFWPMELWFYRMNPQRTDLPPFFYMMFYRPQQGGEFTLYNPFVDGPEALAKQITLQLAPRKEIVDRLLQSVGHEVALASVNLNPAERVSFQDPRPSQGNAQILARVEMFPTEGVDTSYARRFAVNRGDTDATVAYRTMPVDSTVVALRDERGVPFLHYALQVPPERMLLGNLEGSYYLAFEVGVEVTDSRGAEVVSTGERLERYFDEPRAQRLIRRPLAFLDRIDLVPGVYDVSLTLRNTINDDRGVVRRRVRVPAPDGESWSLSDVLVAERAVALEGPARGEGPRAFRFEGQQFIPLAGGRTASRGELVLYAQLTPPQGAVGDVAVEEVGATVLDADGGELATVYGSAPEVRAAPQPTPLQVGLPLSGLPVGDHQALLFVRLADGRFLSRQAPLTVEPGGSRTADERGLGDDSDPADGGDSGGPMPEILLAGEPSPGDLVEYRIRGTQHLHKGELTAAAQFFRAGLERDPDAADLRRSLASVLLRQERPAEAGEVLRPLAVTAPSPAPGDVLSLARALRLAGQPAEAVATVRDLIEAGRPTSVAYNELAEGLLSLGRIEEAAEAWEESLRLDPEQPAVREALQRLSTGRGQERGNAGDGRAER